MMTKNELQILAEMLEEKGEVFGYYAEDKKFVEARIRAEVAMATVFEIAKRLGIDNAYEIKEAGIRKGKAKFFELHPAE